MNMLFNRGKANDKGDEFAMDMKDGIKRPEVKRQAMESVEAVEKSHRTSLILPAPKNDKDDFTMDRMDGIKRPEVKKRALEGVEALNNDRDYGMFPIEKSPLVRRQSTRTSVVLEEEITGKILKNQGVSQKDIKALYQETAFDALDGVRSKRKSCSRDTKRDLAIVQQYLTDGLHSDTMFDDVSDGRSDGRGYGEILVDTSSMDISAITTQTETTSERRM